MGMLVISRRKGESVQLYVKPDYKVVFEVVDLYQHAVMVKMTVGVLSSIVEAPYGNLQNLFGGTLCITRHYWNGAIIEQVKMAFDLPREVTVSRTEWLERKGLRIEDMA